MHVLKQCWDWGVSSVAQGSHSPHWLFLPFADKMWFPQALHSCCSADL